MNLAPHAEQVLCPLCDPWVEHLWLLLAVFVIGCWCGMVVLAIQRFAAEDGRDERARERRGPGGRS
jgi:hypothetical protein